MPAVKVVPNIEERLVKVNQSLLKLTAEPEKFLIAQPEKCADIEQLLLEMYNVTVESDRGNVGNPEVLTELVVEDMDAEQVWQQLELRNNLVLNDMIAKTAKFLALRETKLEVHLKEDGEDDLEQLNDNEDDDDDRGEEEEDLVNEEDFDEDDDDDESENEELEDDVAYDEKPKIKKKQRKSIVDDKFFKLDEMEAFLEAEEAKDERKQRGKLLAKDDDGIDYFAEDFGDMNDSDDEESNPAYQDFFEVEEDLEGMENVSKKNKKKQKDHFADNNDEAAEVEDDDAEEASDGEKNSSEDEDEHDEDNVEQNEQNETNNNLEASSGSDDSESEQEDKPKSSFEVRQSRLEQRIRDYESEVLGDKPWQLKGEIQATSRPQNSLLEEILEFDSTVRPDPIITEETTRCLEDIIKQRIRNKAWDDVVRIAKPVKTPQDYRKLLVLDQEKSKESLAHIYEKEYQREMEKLNPNNDANEPAETKEHQEIRKLMRELFIKLDALSNFHFTPKPVGAEPKIITNTPAVAMEEVAPVAVSDAKLLAPQEVFRGPKHELIGKSERSKTDKNRALRQKKSKQKAIHKALEAKDIERQKKGIQLSKKEESAKLMKKLTKQRNIEKITTSNDQGALKSSKAFFSKLQDQSTTSNGSKPTKRKPDAKSLSAKRLKL